MLNGMVHLMTGSHEPFDPAFYERLVTCLNKIEEPRLLKAVDAQWQGFLDYSDTHGSESDPWPACNDPALVSCDKAVELFSQVNRAANLHPSDQSFFPFGNKNKNKQKVAKVCLLLEIGKVAI